MAEERLTVTYDGPALVSGRMDVRDLAPALIGLADAISAANRICNPGTPAPGVAISATREGSFEVILHIVESGILGKVADLLSGREVTAGVNLAALVGVTIGGVKFVQKLGTRRKIRDLSQPAQGMIVVTFNDGTQIELPEQSVSVARDVEFREAAKKTVAPLDEGNIDSLSIASVETDVQITPSDKAAFIVPDVEEMELPPTTSERYLRLLNVAFTEGHKWKVAEGDVSYWADIKDLEFLHRVETNQESFAAGDVLRVELESRQWSTVSGIRMERAITRVIDHIPGPRQIPLPIADEEDDEPIADEEDEEPIADEEDDEGNPWLDYPP